jgi:hypothetical protein
MYQLLNDNILPHNFTSFIFLLLFYKINYLHPNIVVFLLQLVFINEFNSLDRLFFIVSSICFAILFQACGISVSVFIFISHTSIFIFQELHNFLVGSFELYTDKSVFIILFTFSFLSCSIFSFFIFCKLLVLSADHLFISSTNLSSFLFQNIVVYLVVYDETALSNATLSEYHFFKFSSFSFFIYSLLYFGCCASAVCLSCSFAQSNNHSFS